MPANHLLLFSVPILVGEASALLSRGRAGGVWATERRWNDRPDPGPQHSTLNGALGVEGWELNGECF
jgi:hypothetical protein